MKPIIGITMGDPRGIGPEIVAKVWKGLPAAKQAQILIYGDMAVLSAAANLVGAAFDTKHLIITSSIRPQVMQIDDPEAARVAFSALDAAVSDALDGKIAAVVTAPVNKQRLRLIKHSFSGHTEYIARLAKTPDATMMFAPEKESSTQNILGRNVCFSLVTTHIALRNVADSITEKRVLSTIMRTSEALAKYFNLADARIAVLSLNPHAGEGGAIGTEEKEVIIPAIEKAVEKGVNCLGPIASDSLFRNPASFDYDAVIAMYHDQGLIPAKFAGEGKFVNITLGLPFIRTSPGHGPAEDIAWLGKANDEPMAAAVRMAVKLVNRGS